jgi:hypothetical protein
MAPVEFEFAVIWNGASPKVWLGMLKLIVGVVASVIVKGSATEVPPPGPGFETVISAVPLAAIAEAGTEAVSCVPFT